MKEFVQSSENIPINDGGPPTLPPEITDVSGQPGAEQVALTERLGTSSEPPEEVFELTGNGEEPSEPSDQPTDHTPETASSQPSETEVPAQTATAGGGSGKPPRDTKLPTGGNGENDDSSGDTPQDDGSPEAAQDIDTLRARILREAIEDAERIETERTVTYFETYTNDIRLDKLADAVDADDGAEIQTQLDAILSLPGTSPTAKIEAYAMASQRNHPGAEEALLDMLAEERETSLIEVAEKQQENAEGWTARFPYAPSHLLEKAIETRRRYDADPDELIERHSCSKQHEWDLYTNHYTVQFGRHPEDQDYIEAKLNAKVTELLHPEMHPDNFVLSRTVQALGMTRDQELQARLIDRFLEAETTQTHTHAATFNKLQKIGEQAAENPAVEAGTLYAIDENMDRYARALGSTDDQALNLIINSGHARWKLALKERAGVSDEELVQELDDQTSRLLNSGLSEGTTTVQTSDFDFNKASKAHAVEFREDWLRDQAIKRAKQGNFDGVKTYTSKMSDYRRDFATTDCLAYATTPEQVAAVKPDDFTLSLSPGLQREVEFHKARITGDVATLKDQAWASARALRDPDKNKYFEYQHIHAALELIAEHDSAAAAETAKNLMQELRSANQGVIATSYISQFVIAMGTNEDAKAELKELQYDLKRGLPDAESAQKRWRLARSSQIFRPIRTIR